MADKSRHAFGALDRIDGALAAGTIDAFDVLFLKDANGAPCIGWIDKDGNKVILENKNHIIRVDELPTSDGDEDVVYIFNNECYVWDGEKCIPVGKSADLTALEARIAELTEQVEVKVDATTVQTMIEEHYDSAIEVVEF